MQSLDLSGSAKKSDGRFKSLLWPTVDNAWDVDYVGQQGFWICLAIAVLNLFLILLMSGAFDRPEVRNRLLIVGVTTFFVYFVGGMGVRQASWPAAAVVFVLYAVGQLATGRVPGILSIIIGAVLLSNLRATYLAAHWKQPADDEDRPMRFNETLRDKLVDQLPPRAWPILRIPFYIAASLLLVFSLYASAIATRAPVAVPGEEDAAPTAEHSALVLPTAPQAVGTRICVMS
jgi:hypothetical protein